MVSTYSAILSKPGVAAAVTVSSALFLVVSIALLAAFGSGAQTANGGGATTQAASDKPSGENVPSLVIRAEDTRVPLGRSCKFFVELHNHGSTHLTVYMPGLTCYPDLQTGREYAGVIDEYGPPIAFGRLAHRDTKVDFVVLEPGDYYGRAYKWDAPELGTVTLTCKYENTKSGKQLGFSAWVGKTGWLKSAEVRISGGAESLALLEKQMEQEGLARVVVIRKLGYLGETGAIPVLLRALDDKTVVEGKRRYQDAAAYALQRLAGKDLGLPRENEFDPEKHVVLVREWAEKYLKDHEAKKDKHERNEDKSK